MRVIVDPPPFSIASSNPLNAHLYRRLREHVEVLELEKRPWLPRGIDVCHVHWPERMLLRASSARGVARLAAYLYVLTRLKERNAKLIWTFHNLVLVEPVAGALTRWFWPRFHDLVDGVISMTEDAQQAAFAAVPALRKLPSAVIRRGHYGPIIGKLPPRDVARARLGLPRGKFLFLFFGNIRHYKNVEELMQEFTALQPCGALLVIAGMPWPGSGLDRKVRALAAGHDDVRLDLRLLPTDVLNDYLAAADMVVLPYRQILNSAALLLALSAARPVICPRQGSLGQIADEVGAGWVRTYEGPFSREQLAAALAAPPPVGDAPDLSRHDWDGIVHEHLDFYARVAGKPPCRPSRAARGPAPFP